MDREEILRASRKENKNQDIFELDVIKAGQRAGGIAALVVAFALMCLDIFLGKEMLYGYYAIILTAGAGMWIVKAIKLKRKHEILLAVLWTIMSAFMLIAHVYNLFH